MRSSRANIVAIGNQKGGVGKTTTVTSLATAFAMLGKRVLIVDFDPQGNSSDWMGVYTEARQKNKNVTAAIQHNLTFPKVVLSTSNPKIDIVAADMSLNAEVRKLAGSARQFQLLKRLLDCPELETYNIVLVDTHPAIDPLLESVMCFAHYFIVPVFAEKHPYDGLEFLSKAMEAIKDDINPMLHFLGLVICNYGNSATNKKMESKMRSLESMTKVPVMKTVIPNSDAVASASAQQRPLLDAFPNLPIAQAYIHLAKELLPKLKGKRTGRPQNELNLDRAVLEREFFQETSFN